MNNMIKRLFSLLGNKTHFSIRTGHRIAIKAKNMLFSSQYLIKFSIFIFYTINEQFLYTYTLGWSLYWVFSNFYADRGSCGSK